MALNEVPVDMNSFRMAFLMGSEPARVYDQEQGGFTDDQQLDDEGRPIFVNSVAVQFEGNWGTKNEVMQVSAPTRDKKDPNDALVGQPVSFDGLRARVSQNQRTGVASLRFSADLIVPKNQAQPKQP
ncbi:hypothetical protein G6010_03935 [Dietzia sp. SLG510A3-3B2-2]|nr:hypothetical protein [Dietzia sp. SLG510A3-40A3]MBB1008755.1 hypothetical protein [Dietzia sp. SLG510A3-3B2-2]